MRGTVILTIKVETDDLLTTLSGIESLAQGEKEENPTYQYKIEVVNEMDNKVILAHTEWPKPGE